MALGIRLRKLFGLFLAISVVFAGMGGAHAIGHEAAGHFDNGDPTHLAHATGGAGHVDHAAAANPAHGLINCHQFAGEPGKAPLSGYGDKGACCHAVDSPTNTAGDVTDWTTSAFDTVRLVPHPDQTANSHITDGLLRPPRSRA